MGRLYRALVAISDNKSDTQLCPCLERGVEQWKRLGYSYVGPGETVRMRRLDRALVALSENESDTQ